MKKIMMIGNSHIDPVWLWRESEGMQEVRSTFSSALDRMEEFEEFKFSASSAMFYEWVKENSPDLFLRIKEKVKEGRWFITGGFWVEPDCNIPSGESFVRQALYAQHFFVDNFGKVARVGFNVDSFGHANTLPQILSKAQISSYVFMRPDKTKLKLPQELIKWASPDGSYVLAYRIQGEYCSWTKTALDINFKETIECMDRENAKIRPCFFGVGNHGGGPTIENIKSIRELSVENKGEEEIEHNSLEEFFEGVNPDDLKTFNNDLHYIFPGCYSSDTTLKKFNRQCESNLYSAEVISVLSFLNNGKYPREDLTKSWKKTLFNQFHDTLAGTSRFEGHEDAIRDFNAVLSDTTNIIYKGIQHLTQKIDTRGDGFPLVIFNPHSFEVKKTFEKDLYWRTRKPMRLRDSSGYEIKYQYTTKNLISADARKRIVFETSVPPMGYAIMRMIEEEPQIEFENEFISDLDIEIKNKSGDTVTLGNKNLQISINKITGEIEKFTDAQGNINYINGKIKLTLMEDKRDAWGAAGEYGKEIPGWEFEGLSIEENGPVRQCARLDWCIGQTKVIGRVILGCNDEFITLDYDIRQFEGQTMLGVKIPVSDDAKVSISRPYGFAKIDKDEILKSPEQVTQRWICFSDTDNKNLFVLNDGSFSTLIKNGFANVIFARSVPYSQSSGEALNKDRLDNQMDFGRITQKVILMPQAGNLNIKKAIELSEIQIKEPVLLADNNHVGDMALRHKSFISLDCDNAIIGACKIAEKSDDIIFRIYETSGENGKGFLTIMDEKHQIEIKENSIDTYKYVSADNKLIKVDLLEFKMEDENE